MDWVRAIERNSEALKSIVATIVVMLEQVGGATMTRISRPLHRAVLSVPRPAESAVRRLIVIAARDLTVKLSPSRPMPQGLIGQGGPRTRLAFQLFDPRRRLAIRRSGPASRAVPRIHVFGHDPRITALWPSPPTPAAAPAPPSDDGRIDASRLSLRLQALKLALDDLPRQARRLVRLRARRAESPELRFTSPLRPGRPPGYRKIPIHEVDRVLAECHGLAWHLEPDTS